MKQLTKQLMKAFLCLAPFLAASQDGTLDTNFDADGILEGNGIGYVNVDLLAGLELFVYPDGKVMIGKTAGSPTGQPLSFGFSRLQSNGVPDITFSDDGVEIGHIAAYLTDFVLASNGHVIGLGIDPALSSRVLMRYNASGDLLSGSTEPNQGADMRQLEIKPDGKLVTAGAVGSPADKRFFVGQLNSDFSLDASFGSGGGVSITFDGPGIARQLALTENNLIVVAGDYVAGQDRDVGVAVVGPTGAPAFGFSNDGKRSLDFSGDDFLSALVVQPDGKYLVAGQNVNLTGRDLFLARIHPNGTLDNSFGNQGKVVIDVSGKEDWPADMALQPDGKILISGSACFNGAGCDFMLARFNKDGTLDAAFGENGYVLTDISGLEDRAYAMGLDPSGGVYVAGGVTVEPGLTTGNYAITKYLTDLSVDLSEPNDTEGSVLIYPNPVSEQINIQSASGTSGAYQFKLYNAAGQLVNSWDEGWHPAGEVQWTLNLGGKQVPGWHVLEISNGQQHQRVRVLLK